MSSIFKQCNCSKDVLNKKQSPQSDARTDISTDAPFFLVFVLCAYVFFKDYNFNMCSFVHFVLKHKCILLSTKHLLRLQMLLCEMVCRLAGLLCEYEVG